MDNGSDLAAAKTQENGIVAMEQNCVTTLAGLRSLFEAQEDWVSVGHVEYLLDRLNEHETLADWSEKLLPACQTLH